MASGDPSRIRSAKSGGSAVTGGLRPTWCGPSQDSGGLPTIVFRRRTSRNFVSIWRISKPCTDVTSRLRITKCFRPQRACLIARRPHLFITNSAGTHVVDRNREDRARETHQRPAPPEGLLPATRLIPTTELLAATST